MKNKLLALALLRIICFISGLSFFYYIMFFCTQTFADLIIHYLIILVLFAILIALLDYLSKEIFMRFIKKLESLFRDNPDLKHNMPPILKEIFNAESSTYQRIAVDLYIAIKYGDIDTLDKEILLRYKALDGKKYKFFKLSCTLILFAAVAIFNIFLSMSLDLPFRIIISVSLAVLCALASRIGFSYQTLIKLAKKYNITDWN